MDEVNKNTKTSGKMVYIPAEIRTRHLLVQVRELSLHPLLVAQIIWEVELGNCITRRTINFARYVPVRVMAVTLV